MTKDEVLGLSFIFNHLGHLTIKEVFEKIFLINSDNVVLGFNKAALRDYAKKSMLKTFYPCPKNEDKK